MFVALSPGYLLAHRVSPAPFLLHSCEQLAADPIELEQRIKGRLRVAAAAAERIADQTRFVADELEIEHAALLGRRHRHQRTARLGGRPTG